MPGAYHSWDVWSKGHGPRRPFSQEMAPAKLGSGKHVGNTWTIGRFSTSSSFLLLIVFFVEHNGSQIRKKAVHQRS